MGTVVTVTEDPREFGLSLSQEEIQLVILRDELYEGSWEEMIRDLEDRRDGKPFIFKLVNRIEEDLKRIQRLQEFEDSSNENLAEIIDENGSGSQ